uniref:Uncharacterized protein n=2 Tax=viral metagenome TaxID=1070528 RepID=A0A6M3KUV7_9ZZZZ
MTAHQRAAWNRNMVANHERVEFYLKVENVVQNTPHNKRLPKWVPVYDSTYMVGQFD